MKQFLLLAVMCMSLASNAQLRQTIDEELLSELIQAKQEEVRKRFLVNFIRKNIKMTNAVTYNTMYDIMDVLLAENNKTAMTNALVQKVGNYSVTYAAVWYFIAKGKCTSCASEPYSYEVGKKTLTDTAGFTTKGDRFAEVVDAYKEVSKGADDGTEGITIGKNTDFLVGLHNWLLDRTYMELDSADSMHEIGLFVPDPERVWQWEVAGNYNAFWDHYGVARRDSIAKELAAFCDEILNRSVHVKDLAAAVGLTDSESLSDFSIAQLGSWKPKILQESADSIRNETAKRLNQPLGLVPAQDTSAADAQGRALDKGFTMLEEVLSTIREQQIAGNAGNVQIGALFKLFLKSVELFRNDNGRNSMIARIADIITKYVILDPEHDDPLARYGFSIDIEAIILGLEDRLIEKGSSPTKDHLVNVRPFFTIGLNYGYFGSPSGTFGTETSQGLEQVAWAGEKIGLKWRIADWKYTRGQPNGEWFKFHGTYYKRRPRPYIPDVSNWYVSLFASGILYNIADLRTDETFRRPLIGLGTGLTFFNGLEVNLSCAVPVVEGFDLRGAERNAFANVGFDIPVFEYIRAARAKRGK